MISMHSYPPISDSDSDGILDTNDNCRITGTKINPILTTMERGCL